MNKKFIIKKNEEIKKIINNNKKRVNEIFIIYYTKNNLNYNRYCVSVNKKIGKANVRNLYKRRVKDILMKNKFNNSIDYVIILRSAIKEKSYNEISREIKKILEGEENE